MEPVACWQVRTSARLVPAPGCRLLDYEATWPREAGFAWEGERASIGTRENPAGGDEDVARAWRAWAAPRGEWAKDRGATGADSRSTGTGETFQAVSWQGTLDSTPKIEHFSPEEWEKELRMSEGEACNTASGHPQRNVYGAREGHGLARQLVPREPRDTHGYNGCLGKAHGALDSEVRSEKIYLGRVSGLKKNCVSGIVSCMSSRLASCLATWPVPKGERR
jgi:hypothetical protein